MAKSFDNLSMNSSLLGLVVVTKTVSRKSSKISGVIASRISGYIVNRRSFEYSKVSALASSGAAKAI